MDLQEEEDDDNEKLHALLVDFPFVTLCLKCSAAKLQDVDEVFNYGELLVTFPLAPIFDISSGEFKPACRKALIRIFRIFDIDGDNALNDSELCELQAKCFNSPIHNEELLNMKRMISNMLEGGLQNNKVTFDGFMAMMKKFLEKYALQIPWTVLRRCDYNDQLQLIIPDEVKIAVKLHKDQVGELSEDARAFLMSLARNAYSENARPIRADTDSNSEVEDCLTWEALKSILFVLPNNEDDNPWSRPPSFKCSSSRPQRDHESLLFSPLQQSVLLPGLTHIGANLSFENWVQQWELLALTDPSLAQVLLFKLGYTERSDLGVVPSSSTVFNMVNALEERKKRNFLFLEKPLTVRPRNVVKVCVLGKSVKARPNEALFARR